MIKAILSNNIKRRFIFALIFALFYSLCQLIGKYYMEDNINYSVISMTDLFIRIFDFISFLLISSIVVFFLFGVIDYVLERPVNAVKHTGDLSLKTEKYIFKKHVCIFILFLLCWGIYIVIFFPGVVYATTQIMMSMHLPTAGQGREYTDGITIFYNSVSSVLPAIIFGAFYKIGAALGSVKAGVFLYTIIKCIGFSAFFSWMLYKLEIFNVSKIIRTICFLVYAIYPPITFSTFVMYSDDLFAVALLANTVICVQIVKSKGKYLKSPGGIAAFSAAMLAAAFARKTGLYIMIIECIILLFCYRKYFKQILICLACIILIFCIGFEGFMYGVLKVAPGGKQEYLSLPFQQTARYFRDYSGEISKEERDAVDKVLDADKIADLYYPYRSDPVKSTFKDSASKDDIINYFKIFAYEFKKSPEIYWRAFAYQTSRYFYTGCTPTVYGYYEIITFEHEYNKYPELFSRYGVQRADWEIYNISSPENLKGARNAAREIFLMILKLPIVGGMFTVGFNFLLVIMLIIYLLYKKQKNRIIAVCPCIILILGCLMSPVNGSYRYTIPIFFCVPFLLAELFSRSDKG